MGGVNTCKHHQYHAPNKTKPIEYQSRLWALVGGVDIPLQLLQAVKGLLRFRRPLEGGILAREIEQRSSQVQKSRDEPSVEIGEA